MSKMQSTKIDQNIQSSLKTVWQEYPLVPRIVQRISALGGRALLVGGAVRDLFLGRAIKDLDIEVYGISAVDLEKVLAEFGSVILVGKVFGVFKVYGLDADWSLPRSDLSGRKPQVTIDPRMAFEEAFARRDLTVNAMGIDMLTHELIDPFNGYADLQNKILRAPDVRFFGEDPLRFFRVMQFIGRFEMKPDAALNALCAGMDISGVSRERIEGEFDKLFLKAMRPSLGVRWLHEVGRLSEILPELSATVSVMQDPSWHPEGNVFEHTMQALDAAATIEYEDAADKRTLMYAALCHDIGKVGTTFLEDGKIKTHGHASRGVVLSKRMLKRITHNVDLIAAVGLLTKFHMEPSAFVKDPKITDAAYKRLARALAPYATLRMLADLSWADKQGRNPARGEPLFVPSPDIQAFVDRAEKVQVIMQVEEPVLLGRDLLDVVKPGREMGQLLKKAYEIQIDEGIKDKDELKRRVFAADQTKSFKDQ